MEKEYLDIETVGAVVYIPETAVKLKITATIIDENGEKKKVQTKMKKKEIKEAIETFIDGFGEFVITEKGLEELMRLEKEHKKDAKDSDDDDEF